MRTRSWLAMAGVAVGACILFGGRLDERAIWSEEFRWAQIPREMLRSGDFLHPTINGASYYDKPLGSYWLVLAATWIRGQSDVDELSARLPSFVVGVLGVLCLMAIARRLYDDRTAILAGLILTTEYAYVNFARTAAADEHNVAGILAALWIYVRNRDRAGPWVVGLWLVMAITSLMKGLPGFVVPILVIGPDRLFDPAIPGSIWSIRRAFATQRWLLTPWSLLAIPLAALVYFGPFDMSSITNGKNDGLSMVLRENIKRFFDPVNHIGPIWLYVPVLFALAAPWCVLLPAALWQNLRSSPDSQEERRSDQFAIVFFVAIFVFFTAAASRRSYYLLPILPATSLLIGRMLALPSDRLLGVTKRAIAIAWVVLAIAVLAAGIGLWPDLRFLPDPIGQLPPMPAIRWYAFAWLLSLAAVGVGFARLRTGQVAGPLAVIAIACLAYVFLAFFPGIEHLRTGRPFAATIRSAVGDDWPHLAYFRNRNLVYELAAPGPIAEYLEIGPLKEAMNRDEVRWVLVRKRDAGALTGGTVLAEEPTYPWESLSQLADKLMLIGKP